MKKESVGIILMNIGTPKSPKPKDVGSYLNTFLMDKDVIPLPFFLRWLLVHLIIVPRRKFASAAKYKKIWRSDGSPLNVFSDQLVVKLQARFPQYRWAMAMRYSTPTVNEVLTNFAKEEIDTVVLVPMYPQYAAATTGGNTEEFLHQVKRFPQIRKTHIFPEFYDQDFFLQPTTELIKAALTPPSQNLHILFSFHGLPVSLIQQTPGCLTTDSCCEDPSRQKVRCYRRQCLSTARLLAERLGLERSQWSYSFQSRLGRAEWIRPYTEDKVGELAPMQKTLVIQCPAFTIDCLETLEEIGLEMREKFTAAGGREFLLLPCLNDKDDWADQFGEAIAKFTRALSPTV